MALANAAAASRIPSLFLGRSATTSSTTIRAWSFRNLISASVAIPTIAINIPGIIADIWEGVLNAVPKKKTSHMKKRHRQLAGKALKDSKQYLAQHTIDEAHATDVFALAATQAQILSGSGEPSIKIYSTTEDDFPIAQVLRDAHKLGCHHIVTNQPGTKAVSAGFAGEAKVWKYEEGIWKDDGDVTGIDAPRKAGETWAVTLSLDGQYLAGTTHDGRVNVWDLTNGGEKVKEFETKGSFGMCIDLSPDGRFIASGHESGNIYLFSTATSRLLHSLPGLIKPVRAVKFSPGSKLVAAAGDARIISLYDPNSGEQVANLSGHAAWITSLDWSYTGQYLLSGSLDGKVKVWDIDRRTCVATHSESERGIWCVKWLPKGETSVERQKAERFVTAGSNRAITIYREATGG
ncbi:uncharacterized protein Z518_02781 [Rhinocladiella mackenziei CBS 650.93]|uniref:Rhinocladiella mackenziei CBS 650.93 unplaced genomic scaffold supercont1.2, whole genome shotgun sequence n=1 Tax=Rhinocladiella mackenziei CBS 650.93 TaxID=1442369 RepID=A0A0D2JFQ3_9EURO|nr:uncharacterized protein Z518_02781 [Rhinocladiella mackenziei CBS 650.93]KIX08125.1 hypothetical protein Z518_02781 [Rhinocladiella mackenziei CBS 650.93]